MKVFIVDDSEILCVRLRELISGIHGVSVTGVERSVSGAVESLNRFATGNASPDVMILDLRLADGSGIDVLKEAKRRCPQTLVMVLTNFPYDQYRRICTEEGAWSFLDKSMEFEKVGQLLRQMSVTYNGAMHG